jgi:hypothetical protein
MLHKVFCIFARLSGTRLVNRFSAILVDVFAGDVPRQSVDVSLDPRKDHEIRLSLKPHSCIIAKLAITGTEASRPANLLEMQP